MSYRIQRRARAVVAPPLGGFLDELLGGGEPSGGLLPAESFEREESAPTSAAPTGWPSAPPHVPADWDLDAGEKRIRSGDTISGLAARYAGDPTQWRRLWAEQTGQGAVADGSRSYVDRLYHKIDPSSKNPGPMPSPGMWLRFPADMVEAARAMTPATAKTATKTTEPAPTKRAGGLLALAVGAVAVYLATR